MRGESRGERNLNDGATRLQREVDTQDKPTQFMCSLVHPHSFSMLKATGSNQVIFASYSENITLDLNGFLIY